MIETHRLKYVKCFDSNKTMSFKAVDNKLWEGTPTYEK